MDIDDFKKLKSARHKLENIIQKNDFDFEIENQLKEVQRLLNSIHSNHSYFEENPDQGGLDGTRTLSDISR